MYKLNTDGSARGSTGLCGCGGVVRDHKGNIVYAYSMGLGPGSNNTPEFYALLIGLQRCKKYNWYPLAVEIDSPMIVNWYNNAGRVSLNDELFKQFESNDVGVEGNEGVHVAELPPNALLFGQVEHTTAITQRDMLAVQLTLSNANATIVERFSLLRYLGIVGSGVGRMSICLALVEMVHERGYGFLKWFEELNGESSTSTPSTTATPTFATSATIEDLEIKYKIELVVAQAKMEMLQSITEDLAKIKLKK
ncbi:hypothetical protein GIB67_001485 [Kingdonia uniflora]|uniref:RNase H type-1 domain-containing protein n=1 Tax=Kingdonia uniflora TaxID=39325 RepID=A0A7J7MNV8_9MAGN|nr:hypothetical protein GIB67_001485 [Kingdonia uniflora]